jgi:hypothetical protein
MTYPNLAGVITKDDVHSKGTGSYAASYVAWHELQTTCIHMRQAGSFT